MINDKHLFDELIYIGPVAFGALLDALAQSDPGQYANETGEQVPAENLVADVLINLAGTGDLRVALIASNGSESHNQYVINEQRFHDYHGSVIPAKYSELLGKMQELVCLYATVIDGEKTGSTDNGEGR